MVRIPYRLQKNIKLKKFEIGEHVVIVQGQPGSIGDRHIIIEIIPDNNTFEDDQWMYLIDDNRKYYLNDHLKLDVISHRERILKDLLK